MLRRLVPVSFLLLVSGSWFALASCGSDKGDDGPFQPKPQDGGLEAAEQDTTNPPSETGGYDQIVIPDTGPPPTKTVVFAHDDDALFSVDPSAASPTLTPLGAFDCIHVDDEVSMTDLAVDKDGKLYGVSAKSVFLDMKVEGGKVACKDGKVTIDPGAVGSEAKFYGLTFAPATTALGNEESLIGANSNGDLYKIDKTKGSLTKVGNFGKVPSNDGQGHDYPKDNVGKNWELSGDIVFLTNEGTPVGFATLRDCPDPPSSSSCSRIDTLVEIDVSKLAPVQSGSAPIVTKAIRGQVLPSGCTKEDCAFGSIYGIGAWGDKVYGFSRKGDVLLINNSTGEGVSKGTPLPQGSDGFAGAGVTTLAPIVPPPVK